MSENHETTDDGRLSAEAHYAIDGWPQKVPQLSKRLTSGETMTRTKEVTKQINELLLAGPQEMIAQLAASADYLRRFRSEVIVFFVRLTNHSDHLELRDACRGELHKRIGKRVQNYAKKKRVRVPVFHRLKGRQVEYIPLNKQDQEDFCQKTYAFILAEADGEKTDFAQANFINYVFYYFEGLARSHNFQDTLRGRGTAGRPAADAPDEDERDHHPPLKAFGQSPEEQAARRELWRKLNQEIARLIANGELTEDHIAAYVLHERDGLSYPKIAAEQSCTSRQARTRVEKAREKLAPLRLE